MTTRTSTACSRESQRAMRSQAPVCAVTTMPPRPRMRAGESPRPDRLLYRGQLSFDGVATDVSLPANRFRVGLPRAGQILRLDSDVTRGLPSERGFREIVRRAIGKRFRRREPAA